MCSQSEAAVLVALWVQDSRYTHFKACNCKTIDCKYWTQFTLGKYCTSVHLYLFIVCVYIYGYTCEN